MAVLLDFFSSQLGIVRKITHKILRTTLAGQAPPLQRYKPCYEFSDLRELT
jgi:hypothetical protein